MQKTQSFTIIFILVLISILPTAQSKRSSKQVNLINLLDSPKQTMFLTKFDFGVGVSELTIKYKKGLQIHPNLQKLKIALLTDQKYQEFKSSPTCESSQPLYSQTHQIQFHDSGSGIFNANITQNIREHLWFIFVYTCENINQQNMEKVSLKFQINMMNCGSYFGEDQKLLWPYVAFMILWIFFLSKLAKHMISAIINDSSSNVQIILYVGYIILFLSMFYKLVNLIITQLNGESIFIFDMLHLFCKAIEQGFMVSILIAVAWGWSLTYINFPLKYAIIPVSVTALHIYCLVMQLSNEIEIDSYHLYEGINGAIVIGVRVAVGIVFLIGCMKVETVSVGKRKYFIQKYKKFGSAYLFAWPMAVIVCEIILPKYLQHQMITMFQQAVHIFSNYYLCMLFANPDSDYKRVSLKQDEIQVLPDTIKNRK